jgi:hypothetical protein
VYYYGKSRRDQFISLIDEGEALSRGLKALPSSIS